MTERVVVLSLSERGYHWLKVSLKQSIMKFTHEWSCRRLFCKQGRSAYVTDKGVIAPRQMGGL